VESGENIKQVFSIRYGKFLYRQYNPNQKIGGDDGGTFDVVRDILVY